MQIDKATIQMLPEVVSITKACAKHMVSKGIYQWNDSYPNADVFEQDIHSNSLYVLSDKLKTIVGCIVISKVMDEEYKEVSWLTENDKNLYIHRLAVHPNKQGNGYARQLMTFAEEEAKKKQYNSIRLDTFSLNKRNNLFYKKRGYKQVGEVYFPNQSQAPFHCYELIL